MTKFRNKSEVCMSLGYLQLSTVVLSTSITDTPCRCLWLSMFALTDQVEVAEFHSRISARLMTALSSPPRRDDYR